MTKRWAVKVGEHQWVRLVVYANSWLTRASVNNRTLFTSLKHARAVALVTGGKVWRVKS